MLVKDWQARPCPLGEGTHSAFHEMAHLVAGSAKIENMVFIYFRSVMGPKELCLQSWAQSVAQRVGGCTCRLWASMWCWIWLGCLTDTVEMLTVSTLLETVKIKQECECTALFGPPTIPTQETVECHQHHGVSIQEWDVWWNKPSI